jgi:trehalose utilization protein
MRLSPWLVAAALSAGAPQDTRPLRVLVWDEQQEIQKKAYENYLGNHVAEYLKKQPGLDVKSVSIKDPDQGLSSENLEEADVILWWGHVRHKDVSDPAVARIVSRIKAGKTGLVAIHSAHYSKPFKAIMAERLREDILSRIPEKDRPRVEFASLGEGRPTIARAEAREGKIVLSVVAPQCGLGGVRADGAPSHVEVKAPDHPIAKGVPARFDVKQTEMYNEVFTVPDPDTVVFFETWDKGEKFRAGCCWKVGEGRVFYFRPGHETYPVFHQEETLKILHNAALWAGKRP